MVAQEQAAPTGLSPDELAYHQTVIAHLQAAQQVAASWQAHLGMKYRLPEGTQITEAGAFVLPESGPMRLTAVMTEGA